MSKDSQVQSESTIDELRVIPRVSKEVQGKFLHYRFDQNGVLKLVLTK